MRLGRLAPGHMVAVLAALGLLLVMTMNWYGSHQADLARQLTNGVNSLGGEAGQEQQAVKADAARIIARDEKTPFQERATVDRVLLVLLLLAVIFPLMAAVYRMAGRRPRPPWTPTAFAALAAVAAALLLAFRIVHQPGNNAVTTVKTAAPIAIGLLAIIGLGSVWAYRGEAAWAEQGERTIDEPRAPGEPSAS